MATEEPPRGLGRKCRALRKRSLRRESRPRPGAVSFPCAALRRAGVQGSRAAPPPPAAPRRRAAPRRPPRLAPGRARGSTLAEKSLGPLLALPSYDSVKGTFGFVLGALLKRPGTAFLGNDNLGKFPRTDVDPAQVCSELFSPRVQNSSVSVAGGHLLQNIPPRAPEDPSRAVPDPC